MIDIAVLCDRNKPHAKLCLSLWIEFFDASDHLQESFLRQVFREHFVRRELQEETGDIVVIQPDQRIKCLPVTALTAFDQGCFIHRFLLLFVFIYLYADNVHRLVKVLIFPVRDFCRHTILYCIAV